MSYRRLKGDCDDFAVMIAHYAQEEWGYDSKVYTIEHDGGRHAVAAIAVGSKRIIELYYRNCRRSVWFVSGDQKNLYLPLDMNPCPSYAGEEFKIVGTDEWHDLVGRPI